MAHEMYMYIDKYDMVPYDLTLQMPIKATEQICEIIQITAINPRQYKTVSINYLLSWCGVNARRRGTYYVSSIC